MLTGQIISRQTPDKDHDGKRVLVIVYGVLAVDPSSPLNAEGTQFVVSENPASLTSGNLELTIHKKGTVDRKELTTPLTIPQVLCSPIWKT